MKEVFFMLLSTRDDLCWQGISSHVISGSDNDPLT